MLNLIFVALLHNFFENNNRAVLYQLKIRAIVGVPPIISFSLSRFLKIIKNVRKHACKVWASN
jgi:hypothetical protein